MEQYDRDFKGIWIPKEIWLNKELSALEKVVFAEIDSLDTEKGCYASNEYIAQFCNCSVSKVAHAISRLKELDLIYAKSFDGRTRFLGSRLAKKAKQTCKKSKADLQKKHNINIEENIDNNNNTLTSIIAQSDSNNHSVPPVITITLNDKSEYPIYQSDIDKWQELYQSVDIIQELRKMKGWADSNPTKRKTKNGIKRFINAWLSREQDSYHNSSSKKQPKYDVKDMEADDSVDLVKLGKELFGDD